MINFKVRIKNPVFWTQIFLAIVTPVCAYFGLTGADFSTWKTVADVAINAISNPYVLLMVIVSVWNAINDPTTAGIKDSALAMTYSLPKRSE